MDDHVIRNRVFPVLTLLIAVMTLSSYTVSQILQGAFGLTAQSIAVQILTNPIGVLVITGLYFFFFFIAYLTSQIRGLNIITALIFAMIMGAGLFGSVFFFADLISPQIVPEALFLTSSVFVIAVLFQWVTKKDLSHWSWWIVVLLLIALGLVIALIFVQATLLRIVIDLGVVLIFLFYVIWDMYYIREVLPNEMWMHGVLEFFLDFANILIRLIWLIIQIIALGES